MSVNTNTDRTLVSNQFPTEAEFLTAIRRAVAEFEYTRAPSKKGFVQLKVPNHSVGFDWRIPRWRPFGRKVASNAGPEPSAIAALSFLLRTFEIDTVYDIGAADGVFSVISASTESRDVVAHAFEMNPSRHEKILQQIERNPTLKDRLLAHLTGMSDHHEGSKNIWFSRNFMFEEKPEPEAYRENWTRRLKFLLRGVKDRDRLIEAMVEITSVDHFAESSDQPPGLMKIDVDGYEGLVMPGCVETLRRWKPFVLLELHKDALISRTGKSRSEVVQILFDEGYSAIQLDDHRDADGGQLVLVNSSSDLWNRQMTDMILFFRMS